MKFSICISSLYTPISIRKFHKSCNWIQSAKHIIKVKFPWHIMRYFEISVFALGIKRISPLEYDFQTISLQSHRFFSSLFPFVLLYIRLRHIYQYVLCKLHFSWMWHNALGSGQAINNFTLLFFLIHFC